MIIFVHCLKSFNTSHVTLYHSEASVAYALFRRFNTSHVTLYLEALKSYINQTIEFQYISCYSLSRNREADDILAESFNTSHVTLYL